ncbi:hypothetical protein JVU11DRAFT_5763 [Chiua virens]|nr:hypothetical protein JVU11DRAFT_5763 [Chiua virens]
MNVPSPGFSGTLRRGWHSHTDLPYITERSRSGGHLIPPTTARRYSRDALWNPDEIPIHDEPDSMIHDTSRVVNNPIPETDSSTDVHNPQDIHTPSSAFHAHPSPSPNPQHRTNGLTAETSSLSSRSPSRLSISRMSRISTRSGQSLYREYRGPPAHVHIPTPIPDVSFLGSSSSTTLRRGGLSDVMAFENTTAMPNVDDASQDGYRFFPMSTSGVLRYERGRTRPPSGCDHKIEAMWFEYPKTLQDVPEGWTAHRHPEGTLYFVHDETKTFTEVDICDPETHEDIEYFRTFLFTELQTEIRNWNLTESLDIDDVQLVLEPKVDELGVMCCYYFVNPRTRCLFWLDEWEAYEILKDCRGILSTPHKGLAIQEHYWRHWSLYPDFCEVTKALKDEVVRMISHGICDHLTSRKPTSPLNTEELESHLSLIEKVHPNEPEKHEHFVIIIGRIMSEFYHVYFLHFHGEDCARLDLDQRIYGWQYHPSLLMTTVAPLLFMTPVHKVRELHKIYVDDIVNRETWNRLVAKLYSELEVASVLLATVLLNANVSFLQALGQVPSLPQFFTYMSLVASMASIILGLILMVHSRTNARTPSEAVSL